MTGFVSWVFGEFRMTSLTVNEKQNTTLKHRSAQNRFFDFSISVHELPPVLYFRKFSFTDRRPVVQIVSD